MPRIRLARGALALAMGTAVPITSLWSCGRADDSSAGATTDSGGMLSIAPARSDAGSPVACEAGTGSARRRSWRAP